MLKTYVSGAPDAPTVLFLHGGGTSARLWSDVIAETRSIRAVGVDMPGHGESNHIPWTDFPTTAALIEQAAFDAAGGQHPQHIVGLSLGGYVAAELMRRQPDRYASAVITGIHDGVMPNRWLLRPVSKVTGRWVQYRWFASMSARALGLQDEAKARFIEDTLKTSPDAVPLFLDQVCDLEGIVGPETRRRRASLYARDVRIRAQPSA
ncbi:MAG: alpha/beta hydrolase, partial [Pseudomonadota bacterium]